MTFQSRPLPPLSIARDKFHGKGVYAVPRAGRGKTFAEEHVTQMASAVGAFDLDARTVRVCQVVDRSRYFLVEGGPAAPGVKLVF